MEPIQVEIDQEFSTTAERAATAVKRAESELGLHMNADTDSPSKIYHYTTIEGLAGILTGGIIRATDTNYMNDYTEVKYGNTIAIDLLNNRAMIESDDFIKMLIKHVINLFFQPSDRFYAACFCGSGDLLSQWRGYADKGGGYCIELKLNESKASDRFVSVTMDHVDFYRVVYDPKKQLEMLRIIVEETLNSISRFVNYLRKNNIDTSINNHNKMLQVYCTNIYANFITTSYCFKHPGFEEENEYRLIGRFGGGYLECREDEPFQPQAKFRFSNGTMIPYQEFPILRPAATKPEKYQLASIIYGPSLNPELVEHSLRLWKPSLPYADFEIRGSKIPFQHNFSARPR